MVKPKTKRASADRSKISMENEAVVKYWTKHLGITRERLQSIVEKVGNSAASVRKELKS
jgi:3-oxoacyl-[acyl-carrier-protein] synthase III